MKTHPSSFHRLALAGVTLLLLAAGRGRAGAQTVFVGNYYNDEVSVYNAATGATINASLISVEQPGGIAVSGNTLYVASQSTKGIGMYNATTGAAINASFATLPAALARVQDLVVAGNVLYAADSHSGTISTFNATTGALLNANFITNLDSPGGLTLAGTTLYVANGDSGTVGAYNALTGMAIAGFSLAVDNASDVAVAGTTLYVTDYRSIGTYNALTGAAINASFITSGLSASEGIALADNILYATNSGNNTVSKYNAATGALLSTSGFSGLSGPDFLTVSTVPEPSTWALLAIAGVGAFAVGTVRRCRAGQA